MDPGHLDELIAIESTYWWHVAKRAMATQLLQRHFPPPGRLIEGGVGAGGNLLAFRNLGYEVTGFDLMPDAVRHCRSRGLDDVHAHDLEKPWPADPESARAVVMLDVLEHVDDPVKVLREAERLAGGAGGVLVTVPAGPHLYGPWDKMLGHKRRYTAAMLRRQAREAGLKARRLSYWNLFSLPAAIAVRLAEKLFARPRGGEFPKVSRTTNNLLLGCARIERLWLKRLNVPCGLSLVAVLAR